MFFKCFARLRFKQSKKHTKGKTSCHLIPSAATLVNLFPPVLPKIIMLYLIGCADTRKC